MSAFGGKADLAHPKLSGEGQSRPDNRMRHIAPGYNRQGLPRRRRLLAPESSGHARGDIPSPVPDRLARSIQRPPGLDPNQKHIFSGVSDMSALVISRHSSIGPSARGQKQTRFSVEVRSRSNFLEKLK